MSTERTKDSKNLYEVIGGALDGQQLVDSFGWTDEEWAAHDARVAATLAVESTETAEMVRKQRVEAMVTRDGWPRRAVEVALTADELRPGIVALSKVDVSKRHIIVLNGHTGTGKTVAAAWWFLKHQRSAMFMRAATFASNSRFDKEDRAPWMKAPAMVLDDAGSEYGDAKGFLLSGLDELIDLYYGDKRLMMITTNCSGQEFQKRYGERITDRLRECGAWITVQGDSMRKGRR